MLRGCSRRQLFEIHEQSWCPAFVRDGATDYLRFVATLGRQYKHAVPLLRKGLVASGSERIVDFCSGSGGPWPKLQQDLEAALSRPMPVVLADLHPSQAPAQVHSKRGSNIEVVPVPLDAGQVPTELTGFRTLFTAFHHFAPAGARKILQDAVDKGQGIGIFEQTARTPLALFMMLTLPWLAALVTPFVRPFRLDRLFWTWVIPLIPFVLCCDGIVSCLRTYSPSELHTLTTEVAQSTNSVPYCWEIGRVPSPLSPIGVGYLVGYPMPDHEGEGTEGAGETG